jgi:small subunit ribosomal protein S3Ae
MVKKVVDTWKLKQWYQVHSPELFGSKPIGEVVATEDRHLKNRLITVGLDEITGDFSQTYTTVKFRITEVKGKNAYTTFIGHEEQPAYIRTFIKRNRSLIDDVVDVKTADGKDLRIKSIVFAAGKVARDTEAAIRTALRAELKAKVSPMTLDQFLQELFFKRFATKLTPALKSIAPIKRIEIRKTELKEVFAKEKLQS